MILFAVFAFAAIRTGINPARTSGRWIVGAAIILILMIGFRREVGGDWWNYLHLFPRMSESSFGQALTVTEPGYATLNWLAGQLGWSIWFPNLVCAIIFTWGLIKFSRQQPLPALALAVAIPYLVIVVAMAYTRQSAALGFVMLALSYYSRGAMWRVALFLALGTLFHTSTLAIVPIIAAATMRRGVGTSIVVTIIGIVMLYFFYDRVVHKVDLYTTGGYESAGAIPRLIMNSIPAAIFLILRHRFQISARDHALWLMFSLVALASGILIFAYETFLDRLGLYLIPLQLMVFSHLPVVLGSKLRPSMLVVSAVIIYSLAVEVAWLNFGRWAHAWVPYRNYLWETASNREPPGWFVRARR